MAGGTKEKQLGEIACGGFPGCELCLLTFIYGFIYILVKGMAAAPIVGLAYLVNFQEVKKK